MKGSRRVWPCIAGVLLLPGLYLAGFGPACWLGEHFPRTRPWVARAYREIIDTGLRLEHRGFDLDHNPVHRYSRLFTPDKTWDWPVQGEEWWEREYYGAVVIDRRDQSLTAAIRELLPVRRR